MSARLRRGMRRRREVLLARRVRPLFGRPSPQYRRRRLREVIAALAQARAQAARQTAEQSAPGRSLAHVRHGWRRALSSYRAWRARRGHGL